MNQSLEFLLENVLNFLRGAQLMLFVGMCMILYPKRKKHPNLNLLFWLLIVMMIFLISTFGQMMDSMKDSYLYGGFKVLIHFLLVPLVGSFLLKMIIPELVNVRRVLVLLSPNIILTAIYAYTKSNIVFNISTVYTTVLAVLIFIFIVFIAGKKISYLEKRFPNIDYKTVKWVRVVTYVFATWYIVWRFVLECANHWIWSTYYLFLIAIWIFIYHYSVKHIAAEMVKKDPLKTYEDKLEVTSDPLIDLLEKKLQDYINEHRPWLNPSLTLQELATSLGTNRTYLSDYLNNSLNTTFYDYINSYRIRHACELLICEPEKHLIQICIRSGFKSISTFRRAFEKHMGITPAKYRNQKIN